jgi:glycerophosphoryl diester phosphodiesterase
MLGFVRPLAFTLALVATAAAQTAAPRVVLTGYAEMTPETFAPGPPSGAWRRAGQEGVPQFPSQPVQGFSALWPADTSGDRWWVLVDNGFGAKINSGDALLRIYRVRVSWATERAHKTGHVTFDPAFVQLADPNRKLPFPIARGTTKERWLTGADLDPESFVRMPDGSFWIGEEFGPFLVHVNPNGTVVTAPVELGEWRSPDHPHLPAADAGQVSIARVARSRGFESLAAGPGFTRLYPTLESAPLNDERRMYAFDPARKAFTGESWTINLDGEGLTELIGLEQIFGGQCSDRFLGIERDGGQGATAAVKRVHEFRVAGTALVRTLAVDLLAILNPGGLGGQPLQFTFPYVTTEAVWPIDRSTLVLVNDNNFPGGAGRPGTARDRTEFIRLRLPRPLC